MNCGHYPLPFLSQRGWSDLLGKRKVTFISRTSRMAIRSWCCRSHPDADGLFQTGKTADIGDIAISLIMTGISRLLDLGKQLAYAQAVRR